MSTDASNNLVERPPVIAIMGHVDHGKSSLLDYIRETNVVDGEAGGITQHVSAYEVEHENEAGDTKKITFIDTPGHAAFSGMRQRGAAIADIAILIVSAEDSVKAQTIEAINIIKENKIPYLVAINKIDKTNANPEKVRNDLMAHEVYLEGYGGDVPSAEISAKTGAGIDDLLETILLLAELEEFKGDPTKPAEGFVIESHLDPKRGVTATLIIKDGSIANGQFVVSGCGLTSTRMLEDFTGKSIKTASFSSPIQIIGFSSRCTAGNTFQTYANKKEAEAALAAISHDEYTTSIPSDLNLNELVLLPVILKCDVEGMIEATAAEIEKLSGDGLFFKIIKASTGDINESDVRLAASDTGTIIVGFNVTEDNKMKGMNEYDEMTIKTFSIIYKMTEWLEEIKDARRFRQNVAEVRGSAKLLKIFSLQKKGHVVGGRVESGVLGKTLPVRIMRRGEEIATGTILELQMAKSQTERVESGSEFGMMIKCDRDLAEGDILESFEMVEK